MKKQRKDFPAKNKPKGTENMQENQNATFVYNYSAKENKEIEDIRRKYLPMEESKLEELKRLDETVRISGMAESLCAGIGGALIFGIGMCLAMQIIGNGNFLIFLGIILGIIGMGGIIAAYPVYRRVSNKTRQQYAPKILELAAELAGEKNC